MSTPLPSAAPPDPVAAESDFFDDPVADVGVGVDERRGDDRVSRIEDDAGSIRRPPRTDLRDPASLDHEVPAVEHLELRTGEHDTALEDMSRGAVGVHRIRRYRTGRDARVKDLSCSTYRRHESFNTA